MTDVMHHRGPDDCGTLPLVVARDGGGEVEVGAFGHRRLSILDLSACGHQPMLGEDSRYAIVFNGEIYNFQLLRAELEAQGARFVGHSDTEVLLAGWARHGAAFLARLRGMYAFAIWDDVRKVAAFVRDPFGIKPFYVAEHDGCVAFASELRTLLSADLIERAIDPVSVASYLAFGSVQEPLTMVRGARMLAPGTVTEVRIVDGRAVVGEAVPFAHALNGAGPGAPALAAPIRDLPTARGVVREALRDSVAHHMVSDVPVALFLSGGIDSSAVVALASEVATSPLDTFTVVFGEQEFDESGPAGAVAKRFRTTHHEIRLAERDLLDALPHAFTAMDQPSIDGLNTYVVSRGVREAGRKVVLSGLGGDEMFAGYPSFARAAKAARYWPALSPVRGVAARLMAIPSDPRADKLAVLLRQPSAAAAGSAGSRALFGARAVRALSGLVPDHVAPPPPEGLSVLQQVTWYELTGYMRNMLLRDSDVFSMAHGLELRVPFVDREVAAASLAVDDSLKLAPGRVKPLLVEAVADLLPPEVWDRPKQGFTLPFATWMREGMREEIASAFAPARLERVGIDGARVAALWRGFLAGRPGYTWSRPWAIYTLVRWAEALDVALDAAAVTAHA